MQSGPIPTLGDLQHTTPWIWLWCERCQHHAPLACAVAVTRWGADASSNRLRQRVRCTSCGNKGATIQAGSLAKIKRPRLRAFPNKARNSPNTADICAPLSGSTKDDENHIINLLSASRSPTRVRNLCDFPFLGSSLLSTTNDNRCTGLGRRDHRRLHRRGGCAVDAGPASSSRARTWSTK
jgi:hypothetical protein